MAKVLIVDDEPDVCEYLSEILTQEKFSVKALTSADQILEVIKEFKPAAVLMDQQMPGHSGVEVMRAIRKDPQWQNLAFIMVTGVSSEADKILALDTGADDYVVKPFNPRELAARIRAVLRRKGQVNESDLLEVSGIRIDLKVHKVFIDQNEIHLTLTEFKILVALIQHQGRVLSREQIRENALENLSITDRTLDVHMTALRKKLGKYQFQMETVRGVGYRFVPGI